MAGANASSCRYPSGSAPGAVIFDLDDTLYLQSDWLEGAWRRVADAAAGLGIDSERLHAELLAVCSQGSDKGRVIDRALAAAGVDDGPVEQLVAAFKSYRPEQLPAFPGVVEALAELGEHVPMGLLTDGDPDVQRGKLAALGLQEAFDCVVITDELGRQFRKPNPRAYAEVLARLHAYPEEVIYVGDRPDKDVEGPQSWGMRAIRVRMGEYAKLPDKHSPWMTKCDPVAAIREILALAQSEEVSGQGLSSLG